VQLRTLGWGEIARRPTDPHLVVSQACAICQSTRSAGVGDPYGHGSTKTWRLCRGGEEVDKQLVDAFGLVVMHPVRRVGQALHAVEVGYVVAVGLGEVGAEVGIALPPDHQRRR